MKKCYTALLISTLFLLFGCSKDFFKSYDQRIIGTWRITDVKKIGVGGTTGSLPFRRGQFTFNEDGTLIYINEAGSTFKGTWNLQRKDVQGSTYHALQITAVNFTDQQVLGEYYDDLSFYGSNRIKATINQDYRTYITELKR